MGKFKRGITKHKNLAEKQPLDFCGANPALPPPPLNIIHNANPLKKFQAMWGRHGVTRNMRCNVQGPTQGPGRVALKNERAGGNGRSALCLKFGNIGKGPSQARAGSAIFVGKGPEQAGPQGGPALLTALPCVGIEITLATRG